MKFLTRGAGLQISPEEQQQLLESFGLDKPLPAQFVDYVGDTLRLDFGTSITVNSGEPVMQLFFEFLWPTLLLVGVATIFSVLIGVWMGIRAGWRRGGRFDRASMGISIVLYSMPEFWLGMLLVMLFSPDPELSKALTGTKTASAKAVGQDIAKRLLAKGVGKVVFDRGWYRYHGRIKALADGAREGGLSF